MRSEQEKAEEINHMIDVVRQELAVEATRNLEKKVIRGRDALDRIHILNNVMSATVPVSDTIPGNEPRYQRVWDDDEIEKFKKKILATLDEL